MGWNGSKRMRYTSKNHSARYTDDFVFRQLIPYIGNKRKLLNLIGLALDATGLSPCTSTFLDCFSGSTVVSRFAKQRGFAVTANDWEPYAQELARCFVVPNEAPKFFAGMRTYTDVLAELDSLPPYEGWITTHLCPTDDVRFDTRRDRMFYMRKNGMRLDAVRERVYAWEIAGDLNPTQRAALLGPLLYQACWLSNTSGVFKGFHNGWGGQTGTALYRIMADLHLEPAVFHDNGRENHALQLDAALLAEQSQREKPYDVAYFDPPYNQHPYSSNYHVLNTLTLWDKPPLSPKITGHGDKSAIRMDWRKDRRSAYNHATTASREYKKLLENINARWICTSYSTDGFIPLNDMIEANHDRGDAQIFFQGYKRYRVSSQRFSEKPMNVEFVLLTDTSKSPSRSIESYIEEINTAEQYIIATHSETGSPAVEQGVLF